jgi:hypothetical protein
MTTSTGNQNRVTNPFAAAERKARIYTHLTEGWSYEAIAGVEGLSRERVRQIVKECLEQRTAEPDRDYKRVQAARLDTALRLAAQRVADGELKAIDRLIRVLNQMDKYSEVTPGGPRRREKVEDARALEPPSSPPDPVAADDEVCGGFSAGSR